jgi:hydroxymethylpyrimidine pyrophosphatase-like HAD family hydrolase
MSTKRKAIIVDLDGTLANDLWRRHAYHHPNKDWDEINAMCKYDQPFLWCKEIVKAMAAQNYHIIFLTARNCSARVNTEAWINLNVDINSYSLIMREENDRREDWVTKEDLFKRMVLPEYDVLFCLEDKQTVTDMWRRIGLTCLQCDSIEY